MPVVVDDPREVGADRVVNAVSALNTCGGGPIVVVDMGTAVTVDLVGDAGEFRGGAIAPGIMLSADALHRGTASLPMADCTRPGRAVGRSTAESMSSGLYYGWCGLVDGLIDAVSSEAKATPKVVATGGDIALISHGSRRITVVDEFLTLKGLRIIYDNI
jgi:type III pantothenate kinase